MKLELFSTVLLLALPGNLVASRPAQPEQTGCEVRQVSEEAARSEIETSEEELEDVRLPRGARIL